MTDAGQIEALREEHSKLEAELDEETNRPIPDSIRLQELKRQKLRIKDEIAKLTGEDAA